MGWRNAESHAPVKEASREIVHTDAEHQGTHARMMGALHHIGSFPRNRVAYTSVLTRGGPARMDVPSFRSIKVS
jgi:hypothetical protein